MDRRVLVVDDDSDIRDTIVDVLEENGHLTVAASNGIEALDVLRANDAAVCLILLDLMMPNMDGRTFREEQLKDPSLAQIPVVVLSAFRDSHETAAQMGVAGHLQKPVSLEALLALVKRFR